MKSITACVSANVYVEAQKIGSVIESPGFCRASPPWTLSVENLGCRASVGFSGNASSSSGLLICVVLIFHHLPRHARSAADSAPNKAIRELGVARPEPQA